MENLFSLQGIIELAIRIPLIFLCLTVHEFAHGYIAYKIGDNTAKNAGRLTLNPLAHIDWMGAIFLLIFGFGWAKPVPVNPYNFSKSGAKGIVWVSLAGPLSNMLFALVSFLVLEILLHIAPNFALNKYFWISMINLASLNVGFSIFNILPIPPLDGSKVLMYFMPYKTKLWMEQNHMMLYMLLMLAVFLPATRELIGFIITSVFYGLARIFPYISLILRSIGR